MRRRTASLLLKLYPNAWRERFGSEFLDLLEAERGGLGTLSDVLRAAVIERLFNLSGLEISAVGTYPTSVLALAKRPSGFIPILMSLCALAVVIGHISISGTMREPDEGAAAHIFQLLIAGEMPVLAFFTVRWLRKDHKATLTVLAIQAVALALALFPVRYFHL